MQATPKRRRSYERNARQITRAREFRKNCTESEEDAWKLLRGFRNDGFAFRRQHPVGRYLVDFCCLSLSLIVEIDGSAHAQTDQRRHDARRDAWLRSRGYTVLRISSGMVLSAPGEFVRRVMDTLIEIRLRRLGPLTPNPSPPTGERGWG